MPQDLAGRLRRAARRCVAWAPLCAALLAPASHAQDAAAAPCGLRAQAHAEAMQLLTQLVARGHAPGVVADIRCDGKPWLALSAGFADPIRGRPMAPDSVFRIYSMTKPITSVAVMMLVDDGRIRLDDPLGRHLPEFAQATVFQEERDGRMQAVPPQRPVTVRDLLRHSSGITYPGTGQHPVVRRYVERGIDNGSGLKVVPTDGSAPVDSAAELSRRIASIPLKHQPGAGYTYGNSTDVAGRLVEAVSGQPLGQFLAARLFTPLGMDDTGFLVPPAAYPRFTIAYSAPTQRESDGAILNRQNLSELQPSRLTPVDAADGRSVFSSPRPIAFGGAGLVSTAADYQRFLAFLLGQGRSGERRLLTSDAVSEMTRNQLEPLALANSTLPRSGLGFGLGFGVVMDPQRAPAPVSRGLYFWAGAASTYFWVDPARRITGVVMTQVFGGDVAPYFPALLEVLSRSDAQATAAR